MAVVVARPRLFVCYATVALCQSWAVFILVFSSLIARLFAALRLFLLVLFCVRSITFFFIYRCGPCFRSPWKRKPRSTLLFFFLTVPVAWCQQPGVETGKSRFQALPKTPRLRETRAMGESEAHSRTANKAIASERGLNMHHKDATRAQRAQLRHSAPRDALPFFPFTFRNNFHSFLVVCHGVGRTYYTGADRHQNEPKRGNGKANVERTVGERERAI